MNAWKGVAEFPKGLCSREGKLRDGSILVISIARWNQMHIGSVPWNNDLVTVHWEDKWCRIVALDIRCKFEFGSSFCTSYEGGESWY